MTHISSLITDDSRNIYQRLRRSMCYKILESHGLSYPSGASQEAMVKIMEANAIDPTKPGPYGEGVKYQPIQVQDEKGNIKIEMYPEEKPHATANKKINYQDVLDKITKANDTEAAVKDAKIEELEAKIDMLLEKFGGVEITSEPVFDEVNLDDLEPEQLHALCKERGVKVHHKLGKKKLIEALTDGQDTH